MFDIGLQFYVELRCLVEPLLTETREDSNVSDGQILDNPITVYLLYKQIDMPCIVPTKY